ncbi:MAG: hypothetical protein V1799_13255 [bacterium]
MKTSNQTYFSLLVFIALSSAMGQTTIQERFPLIQSRNQQTITGGFGATIIDGKPYYLVHLRPELSFGKLGVGLDLNLRIGEDGKVRKEDFNETYDYLRIIRYIRYGQKTDPLYIRAGNMDAARLGHGSIIYLYRNTASYDMRRVGIELDADLENFGFETVLGDLFNAGVFGVRGYVRPLQFTEAAAAPVLGNLEVGVSYASDFHSNANKTWGDATGLLTRAVDDGTLALFGFDLGFPLIKSSSFSTTFYSDYVKIANYGSGTSVGIDLNFSGLSLVTLNAKYERRFVGEQFLPTYFGALYEKERYTTPDTAHFMTKVQRLKTAPSYEGYYGEFMISILNSFNILGGYHSPVGMKNAGTLHAELDAGEAIPGIVVLAGYDKSNIGPVFKVDNNSILYALVGYKPMPYLVVSMLYEWTFAEEKDDTGKVLGYKAQRRIEPKIGLVVSF